MSRQNAASRTDRISRWLFVAAILGAVWAYGVLSHRFQLFPYPQLRHVVSEARAGVDVILGKTEQNSFSYRTPEGDPPRAASYLPDAVSQGLVLTQGAGIDQLQTISIIDNDGEVLHRWTFDTFDLWPDLDHVPENRRPKARPGGEVAGVVLLEDGDLVLNLEPPGLLRVTPCGEVVWRLPALTHHSVHRAANGHLYASGQRFHDTRDPDWPRMNPEFIEDMVVEVTPEGEIVDEISILDLLRDNGLEGLLYAGTQMNYGVEVGGDLTHINDVEPFADGMAPGVFGPGDILVSLRNLNTVLVFQQATRRIKYLATGRTIRQHDPDFVDGNRISVYDNHALVESVPVRQDRPDDVSSRILMLDALSGEVTTVFEGSPAIPFFSDIMGKHQWLPNGNLLITESRWGRLIEIAPSGALAWEFNNLISEGRFAGKLGYIYESFRLPPDQDRDWLEARTAGCRG